MPAALLAELATEAITDRERVDVADSHAITLGLLLGREDEAVAVVNETLALVDEPELVDPLRASLAIVLVQVPRPAAAIEAARPLLDRPGDPVLLPWRLRRVDGAGDLGSARRRDRVGAARSRGAHRARDVGQVPARGAVHRAGVRALRGRSTRRSRRPRQPRLRRRRHRPRHRPPGRVRVAERPGRRPPRPAHLRPAPLRRGRRPRIAS